jgi:protein TonB
MSAMAIPADAETSNPETTTPETANDRFKRSFGSWLWGSMIAATVFHFALFQFWPTQTAADFSFSAEDLMVIDVLPEIEIPPPPEAISRPATPVMAMTEIDQDITIAPTTFEENPVEALPAPPTDDGGVDLSAAPVFTPMTVFPEIKNRDEVRAALMREYPPLLRNSGVGGRVVVWFFISEDGTVLDSRVSEPSAHRQLNEAALKVADVFRFSPALNRDKIVQVWIRLPITFQVN